MRQLEYWYFAIFVSLRLQWSNFLGKPGWNRSAFTFLSSTLFVAIGTTSMLKSFIVFGYRFDFVTISMTSWDNKNTKDTPSSRTSCDANRSPQKVWFVRYRLSNTHVGPTNAKENMMRTKAHKRYCTIDDPPCMTMDDHLWRGQGAKVQKKKIPEPKMLTACLRDEVGDWPK